MPNRFRQIAARSANRTNREMAEELSQMTALTAEQIERMLPKKADKERFAELMAIVNSSASNNKKVATLRKNMNELGFVVMKVLKVAVPVQTPRSIFIRYFTRLTYSTRANQL